MRCDRGVGSAARASMLLGVLLLVGSLGPRGAHAQDEIPDIDYENLSFRGIGLDVGYLWPDRVEETQSYAVRFDLGYAGPGLRIVPSVAYWSAPFEMSEIAEFNTRIEQLVEDQTGIPTTLDVGLIDYTDVALSVDGHVVWSLPGGLLTYGGLGVTAHILDGDGPAIDGTFVEDLLDSVTAGFNLHLGTEYPVTERFRIYSTGRYEVLPDVRYFRAQVGLQFMIGENAPGELRGR